MSDSESNPESLDGYVTPPTSSTTISTKRKRQANATKGATSMKKRSIKPFKDSWLEMDQFKGWLMAIKNEPLKAFCTACNSKITSGKSELEKHANGAKHQINVKNISNSRRLFDKFKKPKDLGESAVKVAEIKLSAFFSEHNVALSTVDHLVPLLKSNECLNACCVVRTSFEANNLDCVNFMPEPRHLELHNLNMY